MQKAYLKNRKGHVWKKDTDGSIDIFAYDGGEYHNGPRCIKCGYGFCHHCDDEPQVKCEGKMVHFTDEETIARQNQKIKRLERALKKARGSQ